MDSTFTWRDGHLAAAFGEARVLFTTRRGGVSEGPYASLNLGTNTEDDPACVEENRGRLAHLTGAGAGLALGRQVHKAHVHRATRAGHAGDADGQATERPGVACTVFTADCLPVALIAPGGVAMLHAGWRGLAAGVLEEGLRVLDEQGVGDERGVADGQGVTAILGPGAGRCCYEVGDEVRAAFEQEGPDVLEGARLDLPLIAERRLRRSGVTEVHRTGICTVCDERFFSHRRDGGVTGRQAGLAWLTDREPAWLS